MSTRPAKTVDRLIKMVVVGEEVSYLEDIVVLRTEGILRGSMPRH